MKEIVELIAEVRQLRNEIAELKALVVKAPADVLLSRAAAARLIGCSSRTVARMIADGRLHIVEREGAVGILSSECRLYAKHH